MADDDDTRDPCADALRALRDGEPGHAYGLAYRAVGRALRQGAVSEDEFEVIGALLDLAMPAIRVMDLIHVGKVKARRLEKRGIKPRGDEHLFHALSIHTLTAGAYRRQGVRAYSTRAWEAAADAVATRYGITLSAETLKRECRRLKVPADVYERRRWFAERGARKVRGD